MNVKKYTNNTWREITPYKYGTSVETYTDLPQIIYANGNSASIDLKGALSQSGVPTPTTPIQPQETGDRTGNLFDGTKLEKCAFLNGTYNNPSEGTVRNIIYIPVIGGNTYTFSINSIVSETSFQSVCSVDKPALGVSYLIGGNTTFITHGAVTTFTRTIPNSANWWAIQIMSLDNLSNNIMINEGSTALPYEKFGYKIPISSGGENLFDKNATDKDTTGYIQSDGSIIPSQNYYVSGYIDISDLSNVTISGMGTGVNPAYCLYNANKQYVSGNKYNNVETITVNITTEHYIRFSYRAANENTTMLNLGSEPLPYSPYNRTTTPIYLGEVPTTRRIKKLVLDGTEIWNTHHNNYYITVNDYYRMHDIGSRLSVCSHYPIIQTITVPEMHYGLGGLIDGSTHTVWNGNIIFNPSPLILSLTDWKSYLAQQYAAGTPVTVWYVLATPETGIVNEPLRKIGDYADEVSGITIHTIAGANTLSIGTTLQPSEVSVNYKGWHPVADVHERENGAWD